MEIKWSVQSFGEAFTLSDHLTPILRKCSAQQLADGWLVFNEQGGRRWHMFLREESPCSISAHGRQEFSPFVKSIYRLHQVQMRGWLRGPALYRTRQ